MSELTVNDLVEAPKPAKPEHHYGLIRVSGLVLEQIGASIRGCDTQGQFADKGVYAEVHKLLRLPESYTVFGLFLRMYDPLTWYIWVESPDLPAVPQYEDLPEIVPAYRRDEDGTIHLVSIRIEGKWQRTYTPGELTAEQL